MEVKLLYNVFHHHNFGFLIATYFYLTGLSAGSFILTTLSYGFGMEKYKPLGKIGIVIATLLLIAAPAFLLLHVGKPLRAWHLFVYLHFTSPITWGSFFLTIYPLNCLIYGYFIFKEDERRARIFGLIGIPLAILVHGYTGVILTVVKARPLWNSPLMPLLFLVSAIVSGIALMIIVSMIKDRFFSQRKKVNEELILGLGQLLGWAIIVDLFLVMCDLIKLSLGHRGDMQAAMLLLMGPFAWSFLGVETFMGKVIPLILVLNPRTRTVWWTALASV
ncbi:MAG: oxidoreductase, partial [Deltaproteobacteria bacterium]